MRRADCGGSERRRQRWELRKAGRSMWGCAVDDSAVWGVMVPSFCSISFSSFLLCSSPPPFFCSLFLFLYLLVQVFRSISCIDCTIYTFPRVRHYHQFAFCHVAGYGKSFKRAAKETWKLLVVTFVALISCTQGAAVVVSKQTSLVYEIMFFKIACTRTCRRIVE